MPDGSWWEQGIPGKASQVMNDLLALRERGCTPSELIEKSEPIRLAFPNREQWVQTDRWATLHTSTSAEECIKRCGLVAWNGHWCGQRWVQGTEKDCASPFHRGSPSHDEVKNLIQTLGKAFGITPATSKKTATYGIPKPANEDWKGWK